jgi:hypothetical protein
VRGIGRREFTQKGFADSLTAIVIIHASDKDPDRRLDEVNEIGTRHMVVEPVNRIERVRCLEMHVRAKQRIAVQMGHHEHALDPAHRTAEDADAGGIDVRSRGK